MRILEARVKRREIVKLLALGSALPAFSGEAFALFRGIHRSIGAAAKRKILTAHQDASVTAMAELIIPQTDTPGAKATRVNEFIDLIVADWYSEEDRAIFMAGLANLDARTQSLFGKTFVDASVEQQSEILRALGDEMAQAQGALAAAPQGYRGSEPEIEGNFYRMFRDLTLTGYFTSEIGLTQQLHEEITPGRFDGCVSLPSAAAPGKSN